ncbi:hypothetical protein M405DRAFT_753498, partial [Rhizopogon salebrosus TDB-379]
STSNSMNRETFCRAVDSNGQQCCDCEEFFARPQDEARCAECGHGRSKHPGTRKAADAEPSEIPSDGQAHQSSSSTAAVKEIFNRRHGAIRISKAPNKNGMNEVQAMKNRGCYVDDGPLSFERDWSYLKITQHLRKLFPKVFEYLDITDTTKRTASSSQPAHPEKPNWRLLNKTGQTLTIVDIAFPTGTDLVKHKGREKAGVNECHLWFGMFANTQCKCCC